MAKQRSILPNSAPHILQPMGKLVVRLLPDMDDHGLFYMSEHGDMLLAIHNNGYSCHELAKRMVSGDRGRALEQANFILACGGLCKSLDYVTGIMDEEGYPHAHP